MVPGGKRAGKKPVLIIQHAPHEHPAAVRRALETQGIQNHWIQPFRGDLFPPISEISGIISLGGPMGANDDHDHPWISLEIKLLKQAVDEELPVVGICLGGQMLAKALGAVVEKNVIHEIGWFPIELNPEGQNDPIAGAAGENPVVYHWHGDTFHIPKGAQLLGQSQACARQIFKLGDSVYGFQFHPEADHQLVNEWLTIAGVEDEIRDAQKAHGKKTIQDAKTQMEHALRGEKASLKITAAIGSLFRAKKYIPIGCDFHDELEAMATQQKRIIIEFVTSKGREMHLRGKIATLLTIPAGEFMIFQEDNTMLWPIRLDDIKKIVK